ncbi:MAG: hypothetical protein AAF962_14720 [Actinomycetota bacterium]
MTSPESWPEPTAPDAPVYTPPGSAPVPPTSGLPGFTPPAGRPPPIPVPPPISGAADRVAPAQAGLAAALAMITAVLLLVESLLTDLFSADIETVLINLISPLALLVGGVVALLPGPRERVGGILLGLGLAVLCFDVGTRLAFLVQSVRTETFVIGLATILCLLMAALGATWSQPWPGAASTVPMALIGGALVALGRLWFEWQIGFRVDASLSFPVLYAVGGPLVAMLGALNGRSAALLAAGGFGVVLTTVEMWLWWSFGADALAMLALLLILIGFGVVALTGLVRQATTI